MFTTKFFVSSMLRIVSLRLPSARFTTENPRVGGRHVMPLKKLKGARLTCPWALIEDTQAMGRGMSALVSRSCASRASSVLRSISMIDLPFSSEWFRFLREVPPLSLSPMGP
jgi:hypothetical protein